MCMQIILISILMGYVLIARHSVMIEINTVQFMTMYRKVVEVNYSLCEGLIAYFFN